MKIFLPVLILVSISIKTHATSDSAVSGLNTDLVPIYERLMAQDKDPDLVGKRVDLTLTLKHASDRFLLFTDTQVVLDKSLKYYLIKWRFQPNDIKELIGKTNVTCKVSGRIVEVVSGAKASGMPYIIVDLLSIEL